MSSFKITPTRVEVCGDTITPCLIFEVQVEGFRVGSEIYIPVDGKLYSDDAKLLSQVIIEYAGYTNLGGIANPSIIINYFKVYSTVPQGTLVLRCRSFLDFKSINYIEMRRRANEYHDVRLNLKLRFLRFYSSAYFPTEVYGAESLSRFSLKLPEDAVILRAGRSLLSIDSKLYFEVETPIKISGSEWVKDFLVGLGLGSYDLLELPLPTSMLPSASEEASQHFVNAIESLRKAREAIYETLNVGPPLTALRNALIEFCQALRFLGLAEVRDGGCTLIEGKLKEVLQGNEELVELIRQVFTRVKAIATVGPEPTQPHIAPRPKLELYQVESLIGLTAYTLKLLADTLHYQRSHR